MPMTSQDKARNAERAPFGQPTGRKCGLHRDRPYVPVIVHDGHQEAFVPNFKTRGEARAYCERVIDLRIKAKAKAAVRELESA